MDDEAEFMASVRVFAMGWNRAVFPDDSPNARFIDGHIDAGPAGLRIPLQLLYRELVARKREMFPDDRRIIVDSRLKRSGGVVSLEMSHGDVSRIGKLQKP